MVLVKVVVGQLSAATVPDHDLHYMLVGILVFGLDLAGAGIAEAVFPVILPTIDLQRSSLNNYVVVGGRLGSRPIKERKGAEGQHTNGGNGNYQ
jgi:hypothetical protein